MAYREVMMLEVKEVLRLWLSGVPKRQIAAQLGLDLKTVRRYPDRRAGKRAHARAGLRRNSTTRWSRRFSGQCVRSWAGRVATAGRCASRSAASSSTTSDRRALAREEFADL